MDNKKLKQIIEKVLKEDDRLWDEDKTDLNETLLIDLVEKIDETVIDLLLQDEILREKFFVKIKDVFVFKTNDFRFFIEENKIDNSYTQYKNRIGLTDGKRFLKDTTDVVLDFPYKDCVLEGGQSTEEGLDTYFEYKDATYKDKLDENGNKIKNGRKNVKEIDVPAHYEQKQAKRKEIFFNSILAHDEIDRLFDKKALVNFKRFTKDGEQEVKEIKRDENGTIKENLIIKGNNLLALHSLKKEFAGKVKLIYIDPPYNTKNDGFKYNDNFNHSTWLTFMKNRLEVARELLRDDGVIFVQCDDNEQAYLKVLMDEVFGRENFVANGIVVINRGGRDYGGIARTHEYLLIYSRTKNYLLNGIKINNKEFPMEDEIGGFEARELRNRNILFNKQNRPNLYYPFYLNPNNKDKNGLFELSLDKKEGWIEVFPLMSQGVNTVWRWGKEKAKKHLNIDIKGKAKSNGGYMIIQKYRATTKMQRSIFDNKEFVNERGTEHIKELFGNKKFAYPKSEFLLNRIIELATKENDIVLDFHLGSGTTAAVAHKMGRQYIGIEQMDYIEYIAVERLKKVIEGEQGGISKAINWQGGGDFIYFELAKWNEKAKEEILNKNNLDELIEFFDEMYEKYFLNYNLKIKEFKEKVILEENFKNLSLDEQKKMFIAMLDNNQMYVCKSEMEDKKYNLNEKDIELTKQFYGGNNE